MPFTRPLSGSLWLLAAAMLSLPTSLAAQPVSVQKLLERGALEEAVQHAEGERNNVESTYLAAMALSKLDHDARVLQEYARLRESGDASWTAIGESGTRLVQGDLDGAMEAAMRAVASNHDNPYAHYQVGAVASRQNNFERAAQAFERTIQLKPDFAYAYYYGGLAHQRLRHTAKMSEYFETFIRLAPDAPERPAVVAVLRTLRGREN